MTIKAHIQALAAASNTPECKDIGLADPIWNHVGPLLIEGKPTGTATFVAPGRALTAGHVFDELVKEVARKYPLAPGESRYDQLDVSVQAVLTRGGESDTQRLLAGVRSPFSDFAFLNFRSTSHTGSLLAPLEVAVSPPPPGSEVIAFGAPATKEGDSLRVQAMMAVGRVLEINHDGRDQRLPFACFRVDCDFRAGMSGGPVFDSDGRICGVVCSGSLEAYVALIWPALASQIGHDVNGAPLSPAIAARDWLTQGAVHIDGLDRFSIVEDGTPRYAHGLGTCQDPLAVGQTITHPEASRSITIHFVFDGGLKFTINDHDSEIAVAAAAADWVGRLLQMEGVAHAVSDDGEGSATWPPGTELVGEIREVLGETDKRALDAVRTRASRIRERFEMDLLLGRTG